MSIELDRALREMRARGIPPVALGEAEIDTLDHAEMVLQMAAGGLGSLVVPSESMAARQFVLTVTLPEVQKAMELIEEFLE